jgi:hypothetical protein
MTPDQERWAEALAVIQMHGDQAEAFVAERLVALVSDPAGIARWQEIKRRLTDLRRHGGFRQRCGRSTRMRGG